MSVYGVSTYNELIILVKDCDGILLTPRKNLHRDDTESILVFENQIGTGYFRLEVVTNLNKIALSNPIWYK